MESIQEHPRDGSRLLIGYSRGLVVLWEQSTRTVQHLFLGNQVPGMVGGLAGPRPRVYPPPPQPHPGCQAPRCVLLQQLESLAWEQSGKSIVSSHSDGGYMVWAVSGTGQKTQQPVMSTIPYGTGRVVGVGGLIAPSRCRCCNRGVDVFVSGPFPCKAISKILWRTCESGYVPAAWGGCSDVVGMMGVVVMGVMGGDLGCRGRCSAGSGI